MAKEAGMRMGAPATVGIPKAMLYYRYRVLWEIFFLELGIHIVISPDTDRGILEEGSRFAGDEMCLSAKVYMGHVAWLKGRCDYVLVPRISNFGRRRNMCTRFESMYDMCRNIFRDTGQRFITYNVDVEAGKTEEAGFTEMGTALGASAKDARKAYKIARKAWEADLKTRIKREDARLNASGLKVLVGSHSYVIEDPYVGKSVTDFLKEMGVTVIRADLTERDGALKKAEKFSKTMKWEISREITGGLIEKSRAVDGIILVSVFPCGPDAMVNEMILRKKGSKPALNLVLDAQTGTAGLETRLESFVDILRMRERHG